LTEAGFIEFLYEDISNMLGLWLQEISELFYRYLRLLRCF
jgi:hypothetical protein